jgi:hypothetical protein
LSTAAAAPSGKGVSVRDSLAATLAQCLDKASKDEVLLALSADATSAVFATDRICELVEAALQSEQEQMLQNKVSENRHLVEQLQQCQQLTQHQENRLKQSEQVRPIHFDVQSGPLDPHRVVGSLASLFPTRAVESQHFWQ